MTSPALGAVAFLDSSEGAPCRLKYCIRRVGQSDGNITGQRCIELEGNDCLDQCLIRIPFNELITF